MKRQGQQRKRAPSQSAQAACADAAEPSRNATSVAVASLLNPVPSTPSPLALYIHIPFCETKCGYCNFNTYARLEHLIPSYVPALAAEISAWGERLGHPPMHTVFFGGGTPSWLPVENIARVLDTSRAAFQFEASAEISVEVNPGDVTSEHVAGWRAAGINRISMGVQSFDDHLLTLLNRRHSAAQAIDAFRTLQDGGYDNLNIDLIYGLPHQSFETWQRTLDQALVLAPAHLSLYALTIEEGTPMWHDLRRGSIPPTDGDAAADMYEEAERALGAAGYQHYEISNWAKPGRECRHNLVYWRNGPFLGVGPGAHSYLDGARFWNLNSPAEYIKRMAKGRDNYTGTEAQTRRGLKKTVDLSVTPESQSAQAYFVASRPAAAPAHRSTGSPAPAAAAMPAWSGAGIPVVEDRHLLDAHERLAETMILQLRLGEGLEMAPLIAEFGADAVRPQAATLVRFLDMGLLEQTAGRYRLTPRGRLLSNEVFVRLVPEGS